MATTDDNGPERLNVPCGVPTVEDGAMYWYFRRQTKFYSFSWSLTQWLAKHVREFDLVHIHSLFTYAALPAALWARHSGVPYIVRPLGTLCRWGMENRRPWLKKLSFHIVESHILEGAAGIHYTSEQEMLEAKELGVVANPLIIPNAIELPAGKVESVRGRFRQLHPELEGRKVILSLSRLDRKKGLDLLLRAFASLRSHHPSAALVLAGSGDPCWVGQLRQDARQLGIAQDVVWPGFLTGDDKWAALADADVFALPSYSENFGIAALEALACGVPVVVSDQVAIHREITAAGAGLVVPCVADEIAAALSLALRDEKLRGRMRENAIVLASEHFSIDILSRRLTGAYEAILQRI